MSDYLVTDTELGYEADRIRAKTGGSSPITFVEGKGFGDAIDAIPTGGTPTGTKQISITQNGTTTENVAAYANAQISVNVPTGGGGGLTLLASGTYTVTTAGNFTISVSYSGTPKAAGVVAVSPLENTAQFISEFKYYPASDDPAEFANIVPWGAVFCLARSADNNDVKFGLDPSNSVYMDLTSSTLKVSRPSNAYQIQPGDYNWYIWGLPE